MTTTTTDRPPGVGDGVQRAIGTASRAAPVDGPSAAVVDPITVEILRSRLESAAEEMGIVLMRVSRSPLVSEMHHYATALFDGRGRMVALASRNLAHLASIRRTAGFALDQFSFDLQDDDALIANDPYVGGSSLPQLTLMTANMWEDDLVLFPASRLLLTDVGGAQPGGLYPKAHEVYQEGDIIPPVRLAEGGKVAKDVLSRLLKNSRTPERYRADLNALMAANRVGRRRTREILAEFGASTVHSAIEHILDYSERLLATEVQRWPDGTYVGEAACDTDFHGATDVRVRATVTLHVGRIRVDFTGSSPQVRGFINSPLANTETCTLVAILSFVGREVPINEGLLRSVEIVAPEGTVVNPRFPAPVGCSSYHLGREITEAVSLALTRALPERATIPCTSLPLLTLAGETGLGDRYINQAIVTPGGSNAVSGADGWGWPGPQSGIDVSTPEMLERQYGIRVIERRLLEDSAGAGRWRGALGSRAVLEIVGPSVTATAFLAARQHPTPGLAGGSAGTPDAITLRHGSPREVEITPLVYREVLQAGEHATIVKGGGAGFGPPWERSVDAVRADVQDGYVTVHGARESYGVIFDTGTLEVDLVATSRAQAALAGAAGEPTAGRRDSVAAGVGG